MSINTFEHHNVQGIIHKTAFSNFFTVTYKKKTHFISQVTLCLYIKYLHVFIQHNAASHLIFYFTFCLSLFFLMQTAIH